MTETSQNSKTWSSKQNWIKDVLSKSGTELMEIPKTAKNANNKKESKKKMVQGGFFKKKFQFAVIKNKF